MNAKMNTVCFRLLLIFVCSFSVGSLFAQKQTNERAKWFVDSRFGMFIHWGLYSGAEGIWKGEKLRYDNDYAEWIFYRNQIDREEYVTLLDRFDWDSIDPEQWVLLAKKAGMKYITLTAKHHDGFALWDSQIGNYDLGDLTSPKRDIVKELAEACQKHGVKLGLYYSHWVDWEHPNGWNHEREIAGMSNEEYDVYWQGKVVPQMRELLTNYGEISMIWFDMWINHSEAIVSKKQLLQLKSLIRALQPNCLVNSRLGLSIEEDRDIDYKTLGDNQLGDKKENFPWQSPATVAHSWGFHAMEEQWKSTTTLLHSLINNVSLNGNFMLNIGPRANGDVPYEIAQRLEEMGSWLAVNGDAIYGSGAFDLDKNQHDWGKITCKTTADGTTKLYLHVFNWPLNKQLQVTGITEAPQKAYLLADKQQAALPFDFGEVLTTISLPQMQPDSYVSVVVLEYDNYPEIVEGLVAENVYGGYSLTPENHVWAEGSQELVQPQKYGSVPQHLAIEQTSRYRWRVFVDKPTTVNADVSYSFQGKKAGGTFVVRCLNGERVETSIDPTGQTVGEPRSDWHIDRYKSKRVGQLSFSKAGYYDIELEVNPAKGAPVDFQWLWLQ
ncbi:alpha-L-fucosidase [Sunxiuqinia elliptica]